MKTATWLSGIDYEPSPVDMGVAYRWGVARGDYIELRLNTEFACPKDVPEEAQDGEYNEEKGADGYWYYTYTEGPKTKAWVEQQDREYLKRICGSKPDLFLREMTPDGGGHRKGLNLDLPHHRNLQKEFAAEVARVCREKGLSSHPALKSVIDKGLVATPGIGGGGGGGGPSLDEAEVKRLKAEVTQLKGKTESLSRNLSSEKLAHERTRYELSALSDSVAARLREERASAGREWEGKLAEKDRVLRATKADLDRAKEALRVSNAELSSVKEKSVLLDREVARLKPRAVMVPLLPDEAHKALLRVWQGKYGEGLPHYKPSASKEVGTSVGFIAEKAVTKPGKESAGKRWMAKLGLPDPSDAAVSSLSTRRKDFQRTTITSIKEKIAADVYAILGNGHFYVPKHRLANLKIMNDYTKTHPVAVALLESLNRGKPESEWLTESVHLMSKWMSDYQDLDSLKDCVMDPSNPVDSQLSFMDCLGVGHVPEHAMVNGKVVPILGLMEIMAVSRLLGDTDVLGGGGKNAGFVVERDGEGTPLAIRLVKIDAGESFNFDGADNQLIQSFNRRSRAQKLKDPKDLQFGNNQPINIKWDSLSAKQRRAFLETLKKGLGYLKKEANLDLLVKRKGEFDKAAPPGKRLLSEAMINDFKEGWVDYMNIQSEEDIYGDVLKPITLPRPATIFRPKHFGAVHLSITDSADSPVGGGGGGGGEGAGAPEMK